MQRVSAFLPSWDKRSSSTGTNTSTNVSHSQSNSKAGAGGFFGWSNRSSTNSARASVLSNLSRINVNTSIANNRNSNATTMGGNARIQREAFWPATLDLECEKAARIIKSFCADGFLAPVDDDDPATTTTSADEPKTPVKVPKKIPKRIIQNAAGIAVFTCMRSGLWMTGSGGSGILIARKSDGTWSPPSGIMLHTPTLSFIIGVDVYDCVLVINSLAALESITRPRVTLGADVGLTGGPLVPTDAPEMETEINLRELGNTVLTYMKARGQEQVVNMSGCILTERSNENERFYESSVTQMDILSGTVSRHVEETQPLSEVIKLAEGRTDFDPAVVGKIAIEPAPGDANIASPSSTPQSPHRAFGIPQVDDPDPFGVLALEMAGLEIREAGTRLRPASSQLDFHPRPLSSAAKNYRQSGETFLTKSNRESCMSTRTVKSQMTDAYTQTDTGNTPETSPSPGQSEDGQERASFEKIKEVQRDEEKTRKEEEGGEIDYTTVDLTPLKHLSQPRASEEAVVVGQTAEQTDPEKLAPPVAGEEMESRSKASSNYGEDDDAEDLNDDADDEEPVVFEVAAVQQTNTQAVASRMIHAKGSMVTIPKRIPPPLPTRNPARTSLASRSDVSGDASSLRSPLRQEFSDQDLNAEDDAQDQDATITKAEDLTVEEPNAFKPGMPEIDETDLETPRLETHQFDKPLVEGTDGVEHLAEETKTEEAQTEEPKAEEPPTEEPKVEEPELETEETQTDAKPSINELKPKDEGPEQTAENPQESAAHGEAKPEESAPEKSKSEAHEAESKAEVSREDAPLISTPPMEADDFSDSNKKSRLSVDTGATDARSSFEGSSYTTPPTSERHFSFGDNGDDTPKKLTKDAEQPGLVEEKREAMYTAEPTVFNSTAAA